MYFANIFATGRKCHFIHIEDQYFALSVWYGILTQSSSINSNNKLFYFIWFILLRYWVLYICISSKGRDVEGKVCTLIITSISKTHRVVLHKISIGNNVEVCCECMNCIRGVRTQNKRKGEKCDSVVVSYFELYSINWYSVPSWIWGKFKAQTESRINNRVAAWSYLVNIHKNINRCTKYFLASYELY